MVEFIDFTNLQIQMSFSRSKTLGFSIDTVYSLTH